MNALTAAGIAIGAPGALAAVHLTTLCAASLLPPRRHRLVDDEPRRLLVLVSARNEERVIGRAVGALVRQQRQGDIVLVVADRCTDGTAAIAAAAGAEVIERAEGAEPGKAAAIHDGLRAAATRPWDALVTVDADSVVDDGFLDACAHALQEGAAVAQGRSEALPGDGALTQAAVVAACLQGVALGAGTRPARRVRPPEGPGDDRATRCRGGSPPPACWQLGGLPIRHRAGARRPRRPAL